MGIIPNFLKPNNSPEREPPEHAVLVIFPLAETEFGESAEREEIFLLEQQLANSIEEAEAGEFDGNEFGNGECTLYMYGRDADKLFKSVEAVLRNSPLTKHGIVLKRYGPPGTRQIEVNLDS